MITLKQTNKKLFPFFLFSALNVIQSVFNPLTIYFRALKNLDNSENITFLFLPLSAKLVIPSKNETSLTLQELLEKIGYKAIWNSSSA